MVRVFGALVLAMPPSAALAAADMSVLSEASLFNLMIVALIAAIPAAGIAYMLQGWMRLGYAILLIVALFAMLPGVELFARNIGRAFETAQRMLILVVLLSPFFAWGWRVGVRSVTQADARAEPNNGY